jgi:ferric-dicitrate binding protein FerR (iron transport regulator)
VKPEEIATAERARMLMMAALDEECTADERQELETLVADRPDLQTEWTRLRRLKEVTTTMRLPEPPEEVWDRYWHSVYNRAERGLAWLLVAGGATVLAAYGLWLWLAALLADTDVPVLVKAAIFAVALGLIVLLFSIVRERWMVRLRDPYSREVRR